MKQLNVIRQSSERGQFQFISQMYTMFFWLQTIDEKNLQ